MADRPENDAAKAKDVARFSDAYLTALLAGDEVEAEVAIREAMDASFTLAEIDHAIIAPAMWFIGELWENGEISVAEEHLASEITVRVLALQREAGRVLRDRSTRRIMLATPAGEQHVIALRMVANLLREAGYEVVMLGPDLPPDAIGRAAARWQADVVCLSATMPGGGDQVLISIYEVQQHRPEAAFLVGGRGLTSRVRPGPGVEICERVSEAVEATDALLKRAALN
jgi:methanogenic corrinoid protein MtbC1